MLFEFAITEMIFTVEGTWILADCLMALVHVARALSNE